MFLEDAWAKEVGALRSELGEIQSIYPDFYHILSRLDGVSSVLDFEFRPKVEAALYKAIEMVEKGENLFREITKSPKAPTRTPIKMTEPSKEPKRELERISADIAKLSVKIRNIGQATDEFENVEASEVAELFEQASEVLRRLFVKFEKHIPESKETGMSFSEASQPKLNKPMRGDVKKYRVYVKDPDTGNIKKVNFGDPNMEIKRDDPKRRKSFRARHKCDTAKDKTTPRYWSCKFWSKKPVSKMLENESTKQPFFSDCVSWPEEYSDVLRFIQDKAFDIERDEFIQAVDIGDESVIPADDWHIRYKEVPNYDVWFYIHSKIEYVFAHKSEIQSIQNDLDKAQSMQESLNIKPIQWSYPSEKELEDEFHEADIDQLLLPMGYPKPEEREEAFEFFKNNLKEMEIDPETLEADNAWRFRHKDYKSFRDLVKSYGGPKDPDSMVRKIQSGGELPMPVVIRKADGNLRLAGGATRVSIASLAGQKVKALVIDETKALERRIAQKKKSIETYISKSKNPDIRELNDKIMKASALLSPEELKHWDYEEGGKDLGFDAHHLSIMWEQIRGWEHKIAGEKK